MPSRRVQPVEHPETQEIDQGAGHHPPAPRLLQRLRMAREPQACRDHQLRREHEGGARREHQDGRPPWDAARLKALLDVRLYIWRRDPGRNGPGCTSPDPEQCPNAYKDITCITLANAYFAVR